jgi:lysozyme family protein
MDTFNKAFDRSLGHEGGYTNNPDDRGNWDTGIIGEGNLKGTKYGISAMTYPTLDIENLTVDQAKTIYFEDWWMAYNYDRLQCEDVAIKTFDHSINMGAKNGHKLLQRACRSCGQYTKDDGLIGPHTIMSANNCDSKQLISAMRSEAAGLYRLFIYAKKNNSRFKTGWMRRAYDDQK